MCQRVKQKFSSFIFLANSIALSFNFAPSTVCSFCFHQFRYVPFGFRFGSVWLRFVGFFFFFVVVRVAWGKEWNSCGSVGFSFFFWCSLSVNTCNAAEERVKNAK